jgi:hypothetical protein
MPALSVVSVRRVALGRVRRRLAVCRSDPTIVREQPGTGMPAMPCLPWAPTIVSGICDPEGSL